MLPTTTVAQLRRPPGAAGNPVDVVKVAPVLDADVEVPEAVKVKFILPNIPRERRAPRPTSRRQGRRSGGCGDRPLYVAFLGRKAGVVSTGEWLLRRPWSMVPSRWQRRSRSGTFGDLRPAQNTAYRRRIGRDAEAAGAGALGPVSGDQLEHPRGAKRK